MSLTPEYPARSTLSSLLPILVSVLVAAAACGSSEAGESRVSEAQERGGAAPTPAEARPMPGRAWVIFGSDTVVAEVARTAEERERGLMYRDDLPDGTGMLFVFPEASVRSFWMQNTYVALDIGYMDADFTIFDIQQMEPLSTDPHESSGPAMYALEVPKGWFEAHGIDEGTRAEVVFGG